MMQGQILNLFNIFKITSSSKVLIFKRWTLIADQLII